MISADRKLTLISVGILAGCVQTTAPITPAPLPVQNYSLTAADEAAVRSNVAGLLRDPRTATFGPMTARLVGSTVAVCGYVNGTNGFGGYSGMQPFSGIFYGSQFNFLHGAGPGPSASDARTECAQWGMHL